MEGAILEAREATHWGGRKIAAYLVNVKGYPAAEVPSPSTITAILKRHDKTEDRGIRQSVPYLRFEHAHANDLWQMDFKGDFLLAGTSGRCYPLTLLDDHSRYSLCLRACADQQRATVIEQLKEVFGRYGLPLRMSMDNGAPWGGRGFKNYTRLSAWLMQLGIKVSYSRPYHPQTQGKLERFHRSLKAEVIDRYSYRWQQLSQCQQPFDRWQEVYNTQRPHEALEMKAPAFRYRISERRYPGEPAGVESYYSPGDLLRRVDDKGKISFKSHPFLVGRAFTGNPVALRPTLEDGVWDIFFCSQRVAKADLAQAKKQKAEVR